MIISKKSIHARAQLDAAAAMEKAFDVAIPEVVYPDNPDAQAEYEQAFHRALTAGELVAEA